MLSSTGRPRKACSTCKSQKIRCSGERPSCVRCVRLKHNCVYNTSRHNARSNVQQARSSASVATTEKPATPASSQVQETETFTSPGLRSVTHQVTSPAVPLVHQPNEGYYHGIPKSLVLTLVEVYYQNVYNANLLLHKRLFLEGLANGTLPSHVVLSVCAPAANFYRDSNGQAPLREHGFMIEWAQRAGSLVFQDAESLREDNIVTHINLCLFWHSQGSWKICYLHKGAACTLLHILGPEGARRQSQDPWVVEIRRRRFWAYYQAHCHSSDCLQRFEPTFDFENLPLPWADEDFEAGVSLQPLVTLTSGRSNGGLGPEMIRILTLWASVSKYVKNSDPDLSVRVPAIHALDQELADWWEKLPPRFKLSPLNISSIAKDQLPRTLLVNIAFHQSLCALHSSIVPIFSWGEGNETWLSARQLSAQRAYDHACAASELLNAVLSSYDRVSAMPSFISYAAYCGCAIQIPFLWSSNPSVKARAVTNVRANVEMINTIAEYWKFAALLKIYVRCLYNGHKMHPIILENEPKDIDPRKLTSFKVNAPYAQASILEFNNILRGKDGGYIEPGEEGQLEIEPEDNDVAALPQDSAESSLPLAGLDGLPHNAASSSSAPYAQEQHPQGPSHILSALASPRAAPAPAPPDAAESQNLDVFHPLFDPEMLKFFPDGELPDLSLLETSPLNLDYLDIVDWTSVSATAGENAGPGNMPVSEWANLQ